MFAELLKTRLALAYENFILAFDPDDLIKRSRVQEVASACGFEIAEYTDPEIFRSVYESKYRDSKDNKLIIRVQDLSIYVPYDIRKRSYVANIALAELFPKLDPSVLKKHKNIDLNMLHLAYSKYFGGQLDESKTIEFLHKDLNSPEVVSEYSEWLAPLIRAKLKGELSYRDWFEIAENWASLRLLHDGGYLNGELAELAHDINTVFKEWILAKYKLLSASPIKESPVMVHRIGDFIRQRSVKAALIVIDGMSVENWLTFERNCHDPAFDFERSYCFAMIPTTTAISRTAIFSGKLPVSQLHPLALGNEEKYWRELWQVYGYGKHEVVLFRGYDQEIPPRTKIVGVIINTIDDIMHGQQQGQAGMCRDVAAWAQSGDLQGLIKGLLEDGFDVYLTSDHGNVEATGQGRPPNEGLFTEKAGQRNRIYQHFARTAGIEESHSVIKYPGTYLPKDYQYLLCDGYFSFETAGVKSVCHGGMNIEEVIVPFIRVRDVKKSE
jgi:hypothetical protein